jgi:hypothetical protein
MDLMIKYFSQKRNIRTTTLQICYLAGAKYCAATRHDITNEIGEEENVLHPAGL